MGDSEDEYDRKRRDKFRGERTESYQRGEGRRGPADGERRRDEWVDREFQRGNRSHPRGDYRDYRGAARDRYSPGRTHDLAPPMKRMRPDWGDDRRGGFSHDGGAVGGGYGDAGSWPHSHFSQHTSYASATTAMGRGGGGAAEVLETQPAMMSFKAYLITQDDSITDEDAIKKYNEYKLEFKRQQLNEFFITHKDEEWFKTKYHPEEAVKRKVEQTTALTKRVQVFLELLETGRQDKVSVDADKSDELIRLLDAVVIRLEGGTDQDLLALDEMSAPTPPKDTSTSKSGAEKITEKPNETVSGAAESTAKPGNTDGEPSEPGGAGDEEMPSVPPTIDEKLAATDPASPVPDADDAPVIAAKPVVERKRSYSDSDSGSGSDLEPSSPSKESNGGDGAEPAPPGLGSTAMDAEPIAEADATDPQEDGEEGEEKESNSKPNGTEDVSDKEDAGDVPEVGEGGEGADGGDERDKDKSDRSSPEVSRPRSLHRTASIFLRNLAPSITKQEVETMCKRYQGFLRVAIADPQPERRWFRRGWVTFERQVNIKDICWNLNNIRLRDCELGAIVNRDLSRRIRPVNGITSHKAVVRSDIKMSARIVHNLDARAGLWTDPATMVVESGKPDKKRKREPEDELPNFNLSSKNPVLKNITDYLIEEASAEEDELLGLTGDSEEGQIDDSAISYRDESLMKVLDKLLLYLRIVHSVDYYNHCEYPNEDEMPNRCGIMHARGIPPALKQISQDEISDYCRTFEGKIASFLQPVAKISDEEYSKLGHKDPDAEVEKFVQANTQELAKDKWLCPLSGKKFKGSDFVRKHIFNKHTEKVDEVKKEVEYFNNYLRDPKRPQLAEHPGSRQRKEVPHERDYPPAGSGASSGYPSHGGAGGYGGARHGYHHGYQGYQGYGGQGYSRPRAPFNRGRGGGGGSGEFRPVIHYRDLDAPREPEEFI